MTTDPNPPPPQSPPPIELMGALCSLLIHDFANHISIIAGNAQCAQMFASDSERTAPALVSILKASDVAANLLVKCGELRRSLGAGLPPGDLSLLSSEISAAGTRHTGWSVKTPSPLKGRMLIPLHWAVFATWELVRETAADSGVIWIARKAPPENPVGFSGLAAGLATRECVEIRLTWRSEKPFPMDEIRSKHLNLNLLAACELVKIAVGRTASATPSPGGQEITLSVPTAERDL
jgi:hypothetical protein